MYKTSLTVLAGVLVWLGAGNAWAGSLFIDDQSTCRGDNCNAEQLRGAVTMNEPWVAQVYVEAGECLRLEVTQQNEDLEMTVIGVNPGITWSDDDSGFGFMPRIEIESAPNRGYYVVVLSQWAGEAVSADFILNYGRYPAGNPNCANPTLSVSPDLELDPTKRK